MCSSGNVSCQNIPGIATDGASSRGSSGQACHAGVSEGGDRVVVTSQCHCAVLIRLCVWAPPCACLTATAWPSTTLLWHLCPNLPLQPHSAAPCWLGCSPGTLRLLGCLLAPTQGQGAGVCQAVLQKCSWDLAAGHSRESQS